MNISEYEDKIDEIIDAMATDPDVTEEQLREAYRDLGFRLHTAASRIRPEAREGTS